MAHVGTSNRKKQPTESERAMIVGCKSHGALSVDLAAQMGVSRSCIDWIYKRYLGKGTEEQSPGRGRKRITDERDDRAIIRVVRKDRFATAEHIKAESGVQVSSDTIYRRLKEIGEFDSYWAVWKPYISDVNKAKRITNGYGNTWTVPQW